ncbi:hypothetical protein B0H10DRAFT_1812466, partial [Mycena sp. CBHHK59/15]
KTAKEFNFRLDAMDVNIELKKQLLIWLHVAASPELGKHNNSVASKCLRDNHNVTTVGNLMKIAACIDTTDHITDE